MKMLVIYAVEYYSVLERRNSDTYNNLDWIGQHDTE